MLVRVVNDNVHPYTEKFRGNTINIPAGGSIEMDRNEAAMFLGTNPGTAQVDANGIQKPESYKKLRIEMIATQAPVKQAQVFTCMQDGATFPTQEQLDAYIEAMHSDKLDDEGKEALKTRGQRKPKGAVNDSRANRNSGQAKV